MRRVICSLYVAMMFALPLLAQDGDKKGTVQDPRVPGEKIPLAPSVPAAEAPKAFKLPIEPDVSSAAQSKVMLAKDAVASTNPAQPPSLAAAATNGATLSPAEMKRFETGKANYEAVCLACHQPHGLGQEGLAPPLAGSEWVSGPDGRLARIVLHGLRGPITVKNQPFELDMPALGILDDEQIATILTYVRNEWGHSFAPVSTETVKKIREENSKREDAWTQEELLKIP